MLRKRSGKDQNMGHLTMSESGSESYSQFEVLGAKHQNNSFFGVPGLFIGLSPKGLSDCDSVRSPTSPLDLRLFSHLGNPFRSPRSSGDGHHKSWDCSKHAELDIDSPPVEVVKSSETSSAFLGFCYSCEKKLGEKDIYMYRGEKFCSSSCRASEILIDEEMEDTMNASSRNSPGNHGDEVPPTGIFILT